MPSVRRAALLIALGLVLAGCTLRDHLEGREFTVGLTTPLSRPETHAEVVRWLQTRGGYAVVESREPFVGAEKPGTASGTVDVLAVSLQVEGALTRVSVNARTFIVAGGTREQADLVSGQASGDAGALAEHLTRLTRPN